MSGRPSWNLSPCGTPAAYRRHYRKGQKPCQRCADAHNAATRERYAPSPRHATRDQAGRFTADVIGRAA